MAARRSYGTGSLYIRADANGREAWYGKARCEGGQRLHRRLGYKRASGQADGLTRAQAEAELRRLVSEQQKGTTRDLTVEDLAGRYLRHVEALGRKRTTLAGIESVQRVWTVPVLGDRAAAAVTTEDVEDMMRTMRAGGVGATSVRNYIGTLSAMYRYAAHPRRRWVTINPCEALELPRMAARRRSGS